MINKNVPKVPKWYQSYSSILSKLGSKIGKFVFYIPKVTQNRE